VFIRLTLSPDGKQACEMGFQLQEKSEQLLQVFFNDTWHRLMWEFQAGIPTRGNCYFIRKLVSQCSIYGKVRQRLQVNLVSFHLVYLLRSVGKRAK
jgi:hypothetical protein